MTMKKTVWCLFLILVVSLTTQAQVHLRKQSFIEFGVGGYDKIYPSSHNFSTFIAVGKYDKKINAHTVGVGFQQKDIGLFDTQNVVKLGYTVPVKQIFFYYKTDLKLYSNVMNTFIVKGIGRVNIGYESLNNQTEYSTEYQLKSKSDFLLGVGAGLEIEYCPFIIGVQQHINLLSEYQKFSTIPYFGLRFHFH